jgi:hypothetical protein
LIACSFILEYVILLRVLVKSVHYNYKVGR